MPLLAVALGGGMAFTSGLWVRSEFDKTGLFSVPGLLLLLLGYMILSGKMKMG